MQTLYIDKKGASLDVEKARLIIREPALLKPVSVPLAHLERVVMTTETGLTSRVLFRLNEAGVTVVCLHNQESTAAILSGSSHRDGERRLQQYAVVSSAELSLMLAIDIVRLRLRGQQHVLAKALRSRPDLRLELTLARKSLAATEIQLQERPPGNAAMLRGIEGQAAASYFSAYRQLFPNALGFDDRNRRPPKDPVNVVLSLAFTLLHAETLRALHAVGLDPVLGVYHTATYGRDSLACDLDELLRADVELWVWRMFAEQTLLPEDFASSEHRPCELGKAGRARFYAEHAGRVRQWRRRMRRIVQHCVHNLPIWQKGG